MHGVMLEACGVISPEDVFSLAGLRHLAAELLLGRTMLIANFPLADLQ